MASLRLTAVALALMAVATTASRPAAANLALTYDSSVLNVSQGGSVDVRARLSVSLTSFSTDANGFVLSSSTLPFTSTEFQPFEQQVLNIFQCTDASCSTFVPEFPFQADSKFTPTSPNPLANLNLAPGSSVDLDLGVLSVDTLLAPGTYTTDIGVDGLICPGPGDCTILFNPLGPPDIDAGPLTIVVTAVPEPSTIAIFGASFAVLAWVRRRRQGSL